MSLLRLSESLLMLSWDSKCLLQLAESGVCAACSEICKQWKENIQPLVAKSLVTLANISDNPTVRSKIAKLGITEPLRSIATAKIIGKPLPNWPSDQEASQARGAIVKLFYNMGYELMDEEKRRGAMASIGELEQEHGDDGGDAKAARTPGSRVGRHNARDRPRIASGAALLADVVVKATQPFKSGDLLSVIAHIVLHSSEDEILMHQCALALASWSLRPELAVIMAEDIEVGKALQLLMSGGCGTSVQLTASTVLCNISAFGHRENGWLLKEDILFGIIGTVLLRLQEEVRHNLVKMMHNLMCDEQTRSRMLTERQLYQFFRLVNSEATEIREMGSTTLKNLAEVPEYHHILLEAGIMQSIVDALMPPAKTGSANIYEADTQMNPSDDPGTSTSPQEEAEAERCHRSASATMQHDKDATQKAEKGPSQLVRGNVIKVILQLVTHNFGHAKLEGDSIMMAMGLLLADPDEVAAAGSSSTYDDDGQLELNWLRVLLSLSSSKQHRTAIVRHGEGRVFNRIKALSTHDPLMGEVSGSMVHETTYRQLTMAIMTNLSMEQSLFEELEGQLPVVLEFLSEQSDAVAAGAIKAKERISDPRHELAAKLLSNLAYSKALRERICKRPIVSSLSNLLVMPVRSSSHAEPAKNAPRQGATTKRLSGSGTAFSKPIAAKMGQWDKLPEGEGKELMLYGGNVPAATVTCRFLAVLANIHHDTGDLELPHHTFEGLVHTLHCFLPMVDDDSAIEELVLLAVRGICCHGNSEHRELWPGLIDAGVLGALRKAIQSPLIRKNRSFVDAISGTLCNLCSVLDPCPPAQVSAVLDTVRELQKLQGKDIETRLRCGIAVIHLMDHAPLDVLEHCHITDILTDQGKWKSSQKRVSTQNAKAHSLVPDMAVYSLSKLCTRNFLLRGEGLVLSLTKMMDLTAEGAQALDLEASVPREIDIAVPQAVQTAGWHFFFADKDMMNKVFTGKRLSSSKKTEQVFVIEVNITDDSVDSNIDGTSEAKQLPSLDADTGLGHSIVHGDKFRMYARILATWGSTSSSSRGKKGSLGGVSHEGPASLAEGSVDGETGSQGEEKMPPGQPDGITLAKFDSNEFEILRVNNNKISLSDLKEKSRRAQADDANTARPKRISLAQQQSMDQITTKAHAGVTPQALPAMSSQSHHTVRQSQGGLKASVLPRSHAS
ncbi:unnamed protein product [Chrysoparadoxa australica]